MKEPYFSWQPITPPKISIVGFSSSLGADQKWILTIEDRQEGYAMQNSGKFYSFTSDADVGLGPFDTLKEAQSALEGHVRQHFKEEALKSLAKYQHLLAMANAPTLPPPTAEVEP